MDDGTGQPCDDSSSDSSEGTQPEQAQDNFSDVSDSDINNVVQSTSYQSVQPWRPVDHVLVGQPLEDSSSDSSVRTQREQAHGDFTDLSDNENEMQHRRPATPETHQNGALFNDPNDVAQERGPAAIRFYWDMFWCTVNALVFMYLYYTGHHELKTGYFWRSLVYMALLIALVEQPDQTFVHSKVLLSYTLGIFVVAYVVKVVPRSPDNINNNINKMTLDELAIYQPMYQNGLREIKSVLFDNFVCFCMTQTVLWWPPGNRLAPGWLWRIINHLFFSVPAALAGFHLFAFSQSATFLFALSLQRLVLAGNILHSVNNSQQRNQTFWVNLRVVVSVLILCTLKPTAPFTPTSSLLWNVPP